MHAPHVKRSKHVQMTRTVRCNTVTIAHVSQRSGLSTYITHQALLQPYTIFVSFCHESVGKRSFGCSRTHRDTLIEIRTTASSTCPTSWRGAVCTRSIRTSYESSCTTLVWKDHRSACERFGLPSPRVRRPPSLALTNFVAAQCVKTAHATQVYSSFFLYFLPSAQQTMVFAYQGWSRTLLHMRGMKATRSVVPISTYHPARFAQFPLPSNQFLTLDFILIAPCMHSKSRSITEKG